MPADNPYVPPVTVNDSVAAPQPIWRNLTLWFLLAFYSLAVLMGVNEVSQGERSANGTALSLLVGVVLGTWAIFDAKRRGKPIVMSAQAWFLILAYIVVPGYVIVSRGWKGLLWVVVHAAGFIFVATLAYNFSGFARYGVEWFSFGG